MSDITTSVHCLNCGVPLPDESPHQRETPPCPSCGSVRRNVTLSFSDEMSPMHDSLRGKVRDTSLPSKKNPRVDFIAGDEIRKADGKWMEKSRVIDRERNRYTETVTDPETGEIVHHCDEPLSKHSGHGSDKHEEE